MNTKPPAKPGLLCEDANALEGTDANGKPVIEKTMNRDADAKRNEVRQGYGGNQQRSPANPR